MGRVVAASFVALVMSACALQAERTVTLTAADGVVEVALAAGGDGEPNWAPAAPGAALGVGDRLRVELQGQALLTVDQSQPSIVRALGGAELKLAGLEGSLEGGRVTELQISRGVVRALVWTARNRADTFTLRGPQCAAEIRGGEAGIAVDIDGTTTVRTLGGDVADRLPAGERPRPPGQQLTVRPGGAVTPAVAGLRLSLQIETPAADFVVEGDTIGVRGEAAPGALVCANGIWLRTEASGRFKGQVSLSPGEPLVVTAMDAGGRRSQRRLRPARDTRPPTLRLDEP